MKKRTLLIAVAMVLALFIPAALAADAPADVPADITADPPTDIAAAPAVETTQELYAQGLLRGRFGAEYDEQSMALDETVTRSEAITLVVRLLGQESNAKAGSFTHPFTDVAKWAAPYVGYAYEAGLVRGKPGGTFGSAEPATLDAYMTFLLRALGYDEAAGEFSWRSAGDKGVELGLYDQAFLESNRAGMTRGVFLDVLVSTRDFLAQGGEEQPTPDDKPDEQPDDTQGADPDDKPNDDPDDVPAPVAEEVQAVFTLINEVRVQAGLEPVVLEQALCDCAAIRAEEIGVLFEHTRPDGRRCFTVLTDQGVEYARAGENIASGQSTAQRAMDDWMASESHRDIILDSAYTRVGIGYQDGRWVQLFTTYYSDLQF